MVAARTSGLNRKQRKELARRLRSEDPGLDVMHPHAAGIDVGNSAHYVAVRPDRDPDSVRRFECFTADLHRLADWLQQCGVTTVAMQSTGVYWIPLYEILDARGLEVYLVNARHTKNLPGRKSDVQESQWLLKLHTYGLLRNSFHPPAEIRVVRTYWRQRGDHVHAVSTCIQRMQKVLTQMNIQLANVISDLSGWTGQRIVRAMLAGERDPADARGAEPPRHSRHAGHDRQEPRRHVAARPPVCAATRSRDVRRVPATDRRMRSGARTASEGRRRQGGRHGPRRASRPQRHLERRGARVPSGAGKRAAMRRSLTWAVNCTASAAST